MKLFKQCTGFLVLIFSLTLNVSAKEIQLTNGDKITGDIIRESEYIIVVDTAAMGEVTIEKKYIQAEEKKQVQDEKDPEWEKSLSLGYILTSGNTEESKFNGEVALHRKTDEDEYNAKWRVLYTSDNKKLDDKEFYGLLRYAYSFGDEKKWYHFYKFEGEQDRSANINYRLIPATGIGYWFIDQEDYKFMLETAVGYQHTNYRDETDSDGEAVLVPRAYFEKIVYKKLKFTQDLTLYPSLGSGGDYRVRSETGFINPISDKLFWKISLIDDFNSSPQGDTKKNDLKLISSLNLNF